MAHLPGGTRTLSRTTDANLDSELIKSALVLSCSNKMGDHSPIGPVVHFTTSFSSRCARTHRAATLELHL